MSDNVTYTDFLCPEQRKIGNFPQLRLSVRRFTATINKNELAVTHRQTFKNNNFEPAINTG